MKKMLFILMFSATCLFAQNVKLSVAKEVKLQQSLKNQIELYFSDTIDEGDFRSNVVLPMDCNYFNDQKAKCTAKISVENFSKSTSHFYTVQCNLFAQWEYSATNKSMETTSKSINQCIKSIVSTYKKLSKKVKE
jgi:hypothetical protein